MELDTKVAMQQFEARKAANKGKQVDNSSLRAGSPMYYYCRYCGVHTATLPESHWEPAPTVCGPCRVLRSHGLI